MSIHNMRFYEAVDKNTGAIIWRLQIAWLYAYRALCGN